MWVLIAAMEEMVTLGQLLQQYSDEQLPREIRRNNWGEGAKIL